MTQGFMVASHRTASTIFSKEILPNIEGPFTYAKFDKAFCNLKSRNDKGSVFELFCDGLVMTSEHLQPREIYRTQNLPVALFNRLGLSVRNDNGTDSVLLDGLDRLVCLQYKFKGDRERNVNFDDLSSFYVNSANADHRIVITNANRVTAQAKTPRDVVSRHITRYDLEKLSHPQLQRIVDYMLGRKISRQERKELRGYQLLSVNTIVGKFKTEARGIYHAACGTGKTLVSQRVCEETLGNEGGLALIMAPSLNLVSQSLREYSSDLSAGDVPSRFIVVCSDRTVTGNACVGYDDNDISPDDLGMPVTTSAEELAALLTRPRADKEILFVFSTYHSSDVIEQAIKSTGTQFDLAVFDEAHKTVVDKVLDGMVSDFSRALFDDNVPCKRRLFMTATMRFRKLTKTDRDKGVKILSMDDVSQFGPVVASISFAEAVGEKIILPVKLLVCRVHEEELDHPVKDGFTFVDSVKMTANEAIQHLALRKAVAMTGSKKIVTFHPRNTAAAQFAKTSSKLMPGWQTGHVNGTQRVHDRELQLDLLRNDLPAIVTNVRCLSEGIDVPAIEMIGLFGNFSSFIDINQIIGRVVRKSSDRPRDVGYLLVPVVLPKGLSHATDAEALEYAGMDTVRRVICALMDNDETLAELVRSYHGANGSNDANARAFFRNALRDHIGFIDFGSEILEDAIQISILSTFDQAFWEFLAILESFKTENGHVDVKKAHVTADGKRLGLWLSNQKSAMVRERMPSFKREALENLGVISLGLDLRFESTMARVDGFFKEHGHLNFPKTELFRDLTESIRNYRERHKQGKLADYRIERLEAVGIKWIEPVNAAFEVGTEHLGRYIEQNGHAAVPANHVTACGYTLGKTCESWRNQYATGRMTADKQTRLEKMAFPWNLRRYSLDQTFDVALGHLERLKQQGSEKVSTRTVVDGFSLGVAIKTIKANLKLDRYSNEQRQRAKIVGLDVPIDLKAIAAEKAKALASEQKKHQRVVREGLAALQRWSILIDNLRRHIAQGGLADVPQKQTFENYALGAKLWEEIKKWRAGGLAENQVTDLLELGVRKYRSPRDVDQIAKAA